MISWVPVVAAAVLLGQPGGATLSGVVHDAQSGAPVGGAMVALTDLDRTTASGVDGRYALSDVPSGMQHVEVRRLGYTTRTLHAFVPAAGTLEIHISLQPEAIAIRGFEVYPRMVVRGVDPESGETAPPTVALSAAAVRNHPLLAEPDVFAALSGGAVVTHPEAPSGVNVRGGAADQVTFLLDGIPILNPYHSAGLFSAWNPDALAGLRLEPAGPGRVTSDALSGVVTAETRRPGPRVRAQGALSTRQARMTIDGPLPLLSGGYLVSGRQGFPGFPLPDDESTYLRGRSTDWLTKLEGVVAGSELRFLGYGNRNRTGTAAWIPREPIRETPPRNRFEWAGQSWGGEWSRRVAAGNRLRARGWQASTDASAFWVGDQQAPLLLASARRDLGAAVILEMGDSAAGTTFGLRASRSRTRYGVTVEGSAPDDPAAMARSLTVVAASIEHARPLGSHFRMEAGLLGAMYGGPTRLAPRLAIRWTPDPRLGLSATLARTHQVEQSLGNPESVVAYVFPPALFLGAGKFGVPIARSDQAIVAGHLRPVPGIGIGAEVYVRSLDGLLLAGPATGHPFIIDEFVVGTGAASGASLELSFSSARYAMVGSYGFERVRFSYGDTTYVPAFAAEHTLSVGALARPRSATSLRIGLTGLFGRRSTGLIGPFEWEPCNLLDQGCEFAGSPQQRSGPLAGVRAPHYLRLDVGARKHWHVRLRSVEAELGIYATVTNMLGRRNRLTVSVDPVSGERTWIEMQSRVPLVMGLDWRF